MVHLSHGRRENEYAPILAHIIDIRFLSSIIIGYVHQIISRHKINIIYSSGAIKPEPIALIGQPEVGNVKYFIKVGFIKKSDISLFQINLHQPITKKVVFPS